MTKKWLSKLCTFFYDSFLLLAFVIAMPRILYRMWFYGKYRDSLKMRFGLETPQIPEGTGPVVWFHGASVGEVSLLLPIVQRFKQEYPEWRCVATACSEQGCKTAKKLLEPLGVSVFILPFDLSGIIKPVVRAISPALMVFSEGDCWLNLLSEAKRIGAKTVVINAKLSDNSYKRFAALKRLGRNYFSPIDIFLLQDEKYKKRFKDLGIAEEKLEVTGNIKTYVEKIEGYDRAYWQEKLHLSPEDKVLVLGSIHPKDVEVLFPAICQLRQKNIKVLWVPRHIERGNALAHILSKENIRFGWWSKEATFDQNEMIIVDEMGLLKQLYSMADLAFVGGTFDEKVGGHNLLEPLQRGVPLIFGPYIYSQSELAVRLLAQGAGYCFSDVTRVSEELAYLLDHPEKVAAFVANGQEFLERESQVFDKTWRSFRRYITCAKM